MSHLNERIADFVFGEMTAPEAGEASAHLQACSDCSRQVAEFRHTYALLQSAPDVDIPRPVVFEVEKAPARTWLGRWLPPLASAVAASILTAFLISPAPSSAQPPSYEALVTEVQELQIQLKKWETQQRDEKIYAFNQAAAIEQIAQKLSSQD